MFMEFILFIPLIVYLWGIHKALFTVNINNLGTCQGTVIGYLSNLTIVI